MEIEHIREFVTLAENRNFTETAEQLFTTQSTISKHLRGIEKELGTPLFVRTSRRVELNEAGQLFLPFAKKILATQYEYTTAFYNRTEGIHGTLTIGSIPVMAQYNITDIMVRFKNENANFTIKVIEAESNDLKEMLRKRKCELAFIRMADDKEDEFAKTHYYKDKLIAALPINHPLARRSEISIEELKTEDFLLLESHTMMYDLCVSACQKAGFNPNVTYTSHRIETIMDLVRKGFGISLLMNRQAQYYLTSDLVLVPITPDITTDIYLIHCKDVTLSAAASHFLRCIQIDQQS